MNDEFFVDKAHPLLFVLDRHFQPFEIHALAMGVNWALRKKTDWSQIPNDDQIVPRFHLDTCFI